MNFNKLCNYYKLFNTSSLVENKIDSDFIDLVLKKNLIECVINENINIIKCNSKANIFGECIYIYVTENDNLTLLENKGKKVVAAVGKFRKLLNSSKLAKRVNTSKAGVAVYKGEKELAKGLKYSIQHPQRAAKIAGAHTASQLVATIILPGSPFTNIKAVGFTRWWLQLDESPAGRSVKKGLMRKGINSGRDFAKFIRQDPKGSYDLMVDFTKRNSKKFGNYVAKNPAKLTAQGAAFATTPFTYAFPAAAAAGKATEYTLKHKHRLPVQMTKDGKVLMQRINKFIKDASSKEDIDKIPTGLIKATGLTKKEVTSRWKELSKRRRLN